MSQKPSVRSVSVLAKDRSRYFPNTRQKLSLLSELPRKKEISKLAGFTLMSFLFHFPDWRSLWVSGWEASDVITILLGDRPGGKELASRRTKCTAQNVTQTEVKSSRCKQHSYGAWNTWINMLTCARVIDIHNYSVKLQISAQKFHRQWFPLR
jgi:hypothetical protein